MIGKYAALANSRACSRALSSVQSVKSPDGWYSGPKPFPVTLLVANGWLANDLNEDKLLQIGGLFPLSQLFEVRHDTLPLD
jgi:hypothetical protein